jgi:branched-chain amino acid transport system substrate-binding protein
MSKPFLDRMRGLLGGGSKPIKVGVITSRIGPMDYYGTMQIRGLELGIEYATGGSRQVAGRPIVLLVEDDAGDPATGGQKARALIENEGAQILQGCPSSAVAIVLAGIAQEYERVLLVEPAAADSITGWHWNRHVFRTAASVSQDAEAGGRYAVEHLGRTFCFIAADSIFGRQSTAAWKRVIQAHGGQVLGEFFPPSDTADFAPYLRQVLDQKPAVLVQSWAGRGNQALFSGMRDVGILKQMRVTGGLGDREARHALGTTAAGVVGIIKYSYLLPHNPVNDWLTRRHTELYNEKPDLFTGGGAAAGIALVEGLKRAEGNPDAEALIPALTDMSFEGPKGRYTFRSEDHQALQPMYVVGLVQDPEQPWTVPQLIQEVTAEECAPPVKEVGVGV